MKKWQDKWIMGGWYMFVFLQLLFIPFDLLIMIAGLSHYLYRKAVDELLYED